MFLNINQFRTLLSEILISIFSTRFFSKSSDRISYSAQENRLNHYLQARVKSLRSRSNITRYHQLSIHIKKKSLRKISRFNLSRKKILTQSYSSCSQHYSNSSFTSIRFFRFQLYSLILFFINFVHYFFQIYSFRYQNRSSQVDFE